ncbi:hypothetical protein LJC69_04390 [Bacteroidales bacterium OttesenSCG-928-K22]|nr:hypothetical protein [Bacteroidales bacterium OttesenSCG-928-K22]
MNKRSLILASIIMLLTSTVLFTSCGKKNNYEKLIVGQWLYLDADNTDYSYISSFGDDGNVIYKYAILKNEAEGYVWYTSNAYAYSIEDKMIYSTGKNETGAEEIAEVEIISMDENKATLNTLVYTADGVTVPEEILKYDVVKVEETSNQFIGCWKMTQENYETYYNIKENNKVICYEKIGDGEWSAYQNESFYAYGNFVALTYYETVIPNTPQLFISYTWSIDAETLTLTRTEEKVTTTLTLEKVDESELPEVDPEKIVVM